MILINLPQPLHGNASWHSFNGKANFSTEYWFTVVILIYISVVQGHCVWFIICYHVFPF